MEEHKTPSLQCPCRRVADPRVHACLYFISPHGRGLSLLDLETLAQLADTVNIIPLIARADTLTRAELSSFKLKVVFTIKEKASNRASSWFKVPNWAFTLKKLCYAERMLTHGK